MQRFVLTENIRRFRQRLAAAGDDAAREQIGEMLLAAERDLAMLDAATSGARQGWRAGTPEDLDAIRAEKLSWFRQTFADDPRLAALIDPAPGLTMVEINRFYETSSGYPRDEVVGKPLFDLFPDNPDDPGATGVHNLYASLRQVAETGRSHAMALQRYDTHDAEGVWTARYWRPVNTPLHDDQGRLIYLLHVVEEAEAPEGASESSTPP